MSAFQARRANLHQSHGMDYQLEGRPIYNDTAIKPPLVERNEQKTPARNDNALPRFVWNYMKKSKPRKAEISFENFQSLKRSQMALRVTNLTHSQSYLEKSLEEDALSFNTSSDSLPSNSPTQELNQPYFEHFELGSPLAGIPNTQLVSELRRIRTSQGYKNAGTGAEEFVRNQQFICNSPRHMDKLYGSNIGEGQFGFLVRNRTNYVLMRDQWRPVRLTAPDNFDCQAKHMDIQHKYHLCDEDEEEVKGSERSRITPQNFRFLQPPITAKKEWRPASIHVYMPKVETFGATCNVSEEELSEDENEK